MGVQFTLSSLTEKITCLGSIPWSSCRFHIRNPLMAGRTFIMSTTNHWGIPFLLPSNGSLCQVVPLFPSDILFTPHSAFLSDLKSITFQVLFSQSYSPVGFAPAQVETSATYV